MTSEIERVLQNMASTSSNENAITSSHVSLSSTLSLPTSCTKQPPTKSKTLLNIPTSQSQPRLMNPLSLLSVLINYIREEIPSLEVSKPSFLQKEHTPRNTSSHLDWINAVSKLPQLNSMSLLKSPKS